MKGYTFGGTVIKTPFAIYTVIRIPIIFWILWGPVCKMMARLYGNRKIV
jgi:hypothetical protein